MPVISEYFKQHKACEPLAENSIAIRERAVRYFIQRFGDVDPNVVTHTNAEEYKAFLILSLKPNGKKRLPSSINSYISNIKPFFKWLKKWDYIDKDPFKRITLLRTEKKTHKAYTKEEIERIFAIMADFKPSRRKMVYESNCDVLDFGMSLQVAFALAICGMRRGEVFNTIVSDFMVDDESRAEIKLSHKVDDTKKGTWRWSTKGKVERYVPVPSWARDMILGRISYLEPPQPYIAIPKFYYKRAIERIKRGTFNLDDRNCAYRNFNRDLKEIFRRANVEEGKTLHNTRFTLCMNLFSNGIPLANVQQIVGHASITTTEEKYMEFNQRKLCRDAADCLESYGANLVP